MDYMELYGSNDGFIDEEALPTTVVLIDRLPKNKEAINILKQLPDSSALVSLPRYDKFNAAIQTLAKNGCTFKEIAGNNSAILLTILVPVSYKKSFETAQPVFSQPISSNPTMKRIALAIPVKELNRLLVHLETEKIKIEHIFDF